jgi:hypothetical protein
MFYELISIKQAKLLIVYLALSGTIYGLFLVIKNRSSNTLGRFSALLLFFIIVIASCLIILMSN